MAAKEGRIQYADDIQQSTAPVGGLFEKQLSCNVRHEERARKIAEQDLNQKKKQVRRLGAGYVRISS